MKREQNISSRLVHARIQLLLSQPFFGSLCLRLKLEAGEVPTMATDGRQVLYNPQFVEQLSAQELEAVLAHEVMHCALGHHCRRGQRDPRLWNRAADFAINPLLAGNGFRLPAGALLDAAFSGMSAEEIYAELKQREKTGDPGTGENSAPSHCGTEQAGDSRHRQPSQASGNSPPEKVADRPATDGASAAASQGGFGEVMDAVDDRGQRVSEAEKLEQQRQWSVAAEQAQRCAAACGRKPSGVERTLKETRASRQDWRAILRDFIWAQAPRDYRWTPPNRRYVAAGVYLPSTEKTGLGEIVIAVDTSGSIRQQELEQFAGEIAAIADEAQPEGIHVVCADAGVQSEREFCSGEPITIEARGGGGTDFRPVFRWVEERGLEPACLVYLTDLHCQLFPEHVGYPVLWVTNSKRRAPLGETVRLEPE